MATLPYIQLYVADYLADTMHLTTEEHGAYLLIIMNYWQTGKPIPKKRLASVARLSNDRWNSVEDSLSEYFTEDEQGRWIHARIEEDLVRVKSKTKQASAAGKASAAKRAAARNPINKGKSNGRSNGRSNSVEREPNHKDKDKDKDKDKKDIKTGKFEKCRPEWIPLELWNELIVSRISKKLQNTALALKTFTNSLKKGVDAGYSIETCVGEYVAAKWERFDHSWIKKGDNNGNGNSKQRGTGFVEAGRNRDWLGESAVR